MLHVARCLGFVCLIAAIARSQSVSERDGRILLTGQNGTRKQVTDGNLDSEPSLSFDKRQLVFVRRAPGHTIETPLGDVDESELWIASADGSKQPRRVLAGGGSIVGPDGQSIMFDRFGHPQFSPDATRIYFTADAWATAAAIMVLNVATGNTKLLFPGLGVDVIRTGKYRGFLIGVKDPLTEDRGRITVYWLLDPDGKEVTRIGETESDVRRFKSTHDIR